MTRPTPTADDSTGPDAAHTAVMDAVSKADARWFRDHPRMSVRIRPETPHELCVGYGRCIGTRGLPVRVKKLEGGAMERRHMPVQALP